MSTSRWKRGLLILLNPKVGIPLAIALLVLSGPFVYRSHQLSGLPDPGDPFDVEAFGTVEISDDENAYVEYRAAAALIVPLKTSDNTALDKALEGGWAVASFVRLSDCSVPTDADGGEIGSRQSHGGLVGHRDAPRSSHEARGRPHL